MSAEDVMPHPTTATNRRRPQAIADLDKPNADIEALERLSSFLGTLFVKHEITDTDGQVLQTVARKRPKLEGEDAVHRLCMPQAP